MNLDELHEQRKELDILLEEVEAKADACIQRFTEEVAILVHKENMPKTKAEAKIIVEQEESYRNYRNIRREYKALERRTARAKAEYYHERRKQESGKLLDIEASR